MLVEKMWFFLLTVAVISLSGVMMPGPMFAITVAKSYKSASAGSLVAIGHGIIKISLMILIYIGMGVFLQRGANEVRHGECTHLLFCTGNRDKQYI